jgi:hypothetical protein
MAKPITALNCPGDPARSRSLASLPTDYQTEGWMHYGDFREVHQGAMSIGSMSRQDDGSIKATLYRPNAESDKRLGAFPSWRQAERAVRAAHRSNP